VEGTDREVSGNAGAMKVFYFSPAFKLASFFVYHLTLFFVIVHDWLAFGMRIKGRRNLRIRKAILVSNHTLYLDPGILSHAIAPRRAYYSAMESTFRIRYLGMFIRLLGAFPLTDKDPLLHIIKQLKRAMDERGFVHVFAEHDLAHFNQRVNEFKDGAFFLALLLDVPVIPIAIVVKRRKWRGKTPAWLPPRVTVAIEPPLYPENFGGPDSGKREKITALREKTREVIQGAIEREQEKIL
jgi:1-acyl-sn-glycerol-3-phosphate acyltransferase